MAAKTLKLGRGFTLPLEIVTEASAFVATRGAGKSSATAVLVEEAMGIGVQTVVFDRTGVYWGLRSNAKGDGSGLSIYVLGGPHADVPLEPAAGAMIADLVVDTGHSFVLDFSDFSKGQTVRFAADFLERLYDRKARSRSTTLLVIDEAHFYAPQTPRGGFKGDSARLMGAMEDVVGLGRSRGLGVILTTQRTQALNKAVLDLIETLFVMRMLSPRARDAVRAWLLEKQEDDEKGILRTLDSLPTGETWVWSPLRGILERVVIRRIKTFDSYLTPPPGETLIEPSARKELDLDALGEQIKATVERAKADDPKELRKMIHKLEADLEVARKDIEDFESAQDAVQELEAELRELRKGSTSTSELTEGLQKLAGDLEQSENTISGVLDDLRATLKALGGTLESIASQNGDGQQVARRGPSTSTTRSKRSAPVARSSHRERKSDRVRATSLPVRELPNATGERTLVKAERKIIAVLAQFPQGRSVRQIALLTGYSHKGGGFRNALSSLRGDEIISRGDPIQLLVDPDSLGVPVEHLPTGADLLNHWLAQLGKAEREILKYLADEYESGPAEIEIVAESTNYSAAGGGFRNALSKLRTLELIEGRGDVSLTDDFAEAIS